LETYCNRILRINLTTGKFQIEKISPLWREQYFGCKGLGIRYLLTETSKHTNPLSDENKLIFLVSPFAGTILSSFSRTIVLSISPATETMLDCSMGGSFGAKLKFAGYDGLIIEGKSPTLCYIKIENDSVSIEEAGFLKRKGSHETEATLRHMLGYNFSVASIGPAGENLVPYSCINNEFFRHAGRGGIGAVMGSKNLKAIAVTGNADVEVKQIDKLFEEYKSILQEEVFGDSNLWAKEMGTPMLVDLSQKAGILPTNNFSMGKLPGYETLGVKNVQGHQVGRKACYGCAIGCGIRLQIGDVTVEGPEYETIACAGSNCGISDLEAVARFNKICDDLGLDTMSTGGVIAWAMEATEKGIYDFGIRFGQINEYLEIPKLIAYRKGIGADLALGVKVLSEKYGGKEFALEVKGLEYPGYEPRGSWAMALAYATSDRGACHLRAWPVGVEAYGSLECCTIEGKGELVASQQIWKAAKHSVGICDFWAITPKTLIKLLDVGLGLTLSESDLNLYGKRAWNLGRIFNVRRGFDRKDDYLPKRMQEPIQGDNGFAKPIAQNQFDEMLSQYYNALGWDNSGIPTKNTLKQLFKEEEIICLLDEKS